MAVSIFKDILRMTGNLACAFTAHVHRGWDSIPPEHVARHNFPDTIFLRRHGEWWQALLARVREQCLPRRSSGAPKYQHGTDRVGV
jgi:hypothetical protein